MTDRRIVITGMGALSPLGNTVEENWDAMKNGRSGIRMIESIDSEKYAVHIGGEVRNYDPSPYFKKDPKAVRRCDRFEQLAMGAAAQALENAGIDPEKVDGTRVGRDHRCRYRRLRGRSGPEKARSSSRGLRKGRPDRRSVPHRTYRLCQVHHRYRL